MKSNKYRKKAIIIEAIQWGCGNIGEIKEFCHLAEQEGDSLYIQTLEGVMEAKPLDWIICGVKGEFYPCKPDVFEASYEPVEE